MNLVTTNHSHQLANHTNTAITIVDMVEFLDLSINIKIANKIVFLDVSEKVETILNYSNFTEFRMFVQNNLDLNDLNFKTGLQKIYALIKKFEDKKLGHIKTGLPKKALNLKTKLTSAINNKNKHHLLNQKFKFEMVKNNKFIKFKFCPESEFKIVENDKLKFKFKLLKKKISKNFFEPKELFILEKLDRNDLHKYIGTDNYLLEQIILAQYESEANKAIAKKTTPATFQQQHQMIESRKILSLTSSIKKI